MDFKRRVIKRMHVGIDPTYAIQLESPKGWIDIFSYKTEEAAVSAFDYFKEKQVVSEEVIVSD